jgi:hypothetical protein
MKYNDKNTQISQSKQLDKLDNFKSDRSLRRERERAMEDFSKQVCLYVDKDWWDCVSPEQKNSLYSVWIRQKFSSKFNGITLEKWINVKKSEVLIDKGLYREKKINKIIND